MGDKYAAAARGAALPATVTTKFNLTKNQLKIVIFFSLMLVLLMWNSAPFGNSDHRVSIVVGEAEFLGAYENEALLEVSIYGAPFRASGEWGNFDLKLLEFRCQMSEFAGFGTL